MAIHTKNGKSETQKMLFLATSKNGFFWRALSHYGLYYSKQKKSKIFWCAKVKNAVAPCGLVRFRCEFLWLRHSPMRAIMQLAPFPKKIFQREIPFFLGSRLEDRIKKKSATTPLWDWGIFFPGLKTRNQGVKKGGLRLGKNFEVGLRVPSKGLPEKKNRG